MHKASRSVTDQHTNLSIQVDWSTNKPAYPSKLADRLTYQPIYPGWLTHQQTSLSIKVGWPTNKPAYLSGLTDHPKYLSIYLGGLTDQHTSLSLPVDWPTKILAYPSWLADWSTYQPIYTWQPIWVDCMTNIPAYLPGLTVQPTNQPIYPSWLTFHKPVSPSTYQTCDLSRSGVNLPIWRLPLRPPDEAAKIPIFMNSDFSLLPKAKTCFPITADACFI